MKKSEQYKVFRCACVLVISCLMFLASFFTSQAQQNLNTEEVPPSYPKKIISNINLIVGVNLIYPQIKYMENRDLKIGYCAGVGLVHEINSTLDINLKIAYENKGYKSTTFSPNTDYTPPAMQEFMQNVTLNYLTASLYPKVKISPTRRIFFGVGPYFGRLLSTRLKSELYINGVPIQKYGTRPDPFVSNTKYDFGITSLIGYDFFIFKKKMMIEIHYCMGIKNISQPTISEFRNQTISFLLSAGLFK
jgi:hypothetical protein